MYEHISQRPISRGAFLRRMLRHAGYAAVIIGGSLIIGMMAYAPLENLGWWDSFLQTTMLLGGMGLVVTPTTPGAKLFAGLYALYAGLVFTAVTTIVLTPILHRLLHTFHWQERG